MENNSREQQSNPSETPLSQEQREKALGKLEGTMFALYTLLVADMGGAAVEIIHGITEGTNSLDAHLGMGLCGLAAVLSVGVLTVRSKIKRLERLSTNSE